MTKQLFCKIEMRTKAFSKAGQDSLAKSNITHKKANSKHERNY